MGVDRDGAGDQGMMFGYACDETSTLMPMPIYYAHLLAKKLADVRKNGILDFSENTVRNAIDLTRELMQKYSVDINHVIRHFDVTGKICPKPYIDSVKWQGFKNMIKEEDEMTAEERAKFNELVNVVSDLRIAADRLGDRITKL